MEPYETLLDKCIAELPEIVTQTERFKFENVRGHFEGNKTVIVNFFKIAKTLSREPEHLMKYLFRELATPGKIVTDRLILGAKLPAATLNKKIKQYVNDFVICPVCSGPDTKLAKEKEMLRLVCMVCGAKSVVKPL